MISLGALVVGATRSVFSEQFPSSWQYVYGGLFVGVVLLFPDGIVGGLTRFGTLVAAKLPRRRERALASEGLMQVEAEVGGHPVGE